MTQDNSPKAFTSYAQNFEDVMLWRALKHIPAGFYIDIGAQHPVVDSVSKAFYEHGWRGIHVEPVPSYAELLRQDRPDETVMQLAVSDRTGILELNVIENTGLSTGVKAYADSHSATHGLAHKVIQTPMLPMAAAFESLRGRDVHWMKIDVEGLEEEVLRGWDSNALRPWIIVIEATVPMSAELRYEGADRLLTRSGYQFAYFDGLNRFYVAAEHDELTAALQVPPNVFDKVELSGLSGSWCDGVIARHHAELQLGAERLSSLRSELEEAKRRASTQLAHANNLAVKAAERASRAEVRSSEAGARLAFAEARASQADALAARMELRAVMAEERVARAEECALLAAQRAALAENTPMRRLLSAWKERRVLSGTKRRIKTLIRISAVAVNRQPMLKRSAQQILKLSPRMKRRLEAMLSPPQSSVTATDEGLQTQCRGALSPDASAIFHQLKQSTRGLEST
jgi:FkbM family methyltransferase